MPEINIEHACKNQSAKAAYPMHLPHLHRAHSPPNLASVSRHSTQRCTTKTNHTKPATCTYPHPERPKVGDRGLYGLRLRAASAERQIFALDYPEVGLR